MENFRFPVLSRLLDRLLLLISVLAIASLLTEYGFYISETLRYQLEALDVLIIWYFVIHTTLKILLAENKKNFLKIHWFDSLLVILVVIQTTLFLSVIGLEALDRIFDGHNVSQVIKLYLTGFQIFIVLSLFNKGTKFNKYLAELSINPAKILMGSFFVIILLGALLLMLPKAVVVGKELGWLDAFFTATSATCVTGLIVVDTGMHFSRMGQIIILSLIQIGGLGLMTYASFFAVVLRRNISLREKSMMRDMMNFENTGILPKLLSTTIIFTFGVEFVGASFLYVGLGNGLPVSERLYSAIFHSISAFCNAGFSIYPDSFIRYSQNNLVMATLSSLIILGGLGFPVIMNLVTLKFNHPLGAGKSLRVQTRIVLWMTGILLLTGTVIIFALEYHNYGSEITFLQKGLNAFFQSVTARTAGFNSIDTAHLAVSTSLFLLVLMFIGASPGSTGGGIKTTTVAILFAGIKSTLQARGRIEMFRKNIPRLVFNRAVIVVVLSMTVIFVAIFILSALEPFPTFDLIFEVFSAFGTVGLSRGITAALSGPGKFVIMLLMFFGRLGALTISLAIATPKDSYHYEYPSENVMVG